MRTIDFLAGARFGMFIHYGLYSIPGGVWNGIPQGRNRYSEWIRYQGDWPNGIGKEEYEKLTESFAPDSGCAEHWVETAVDAGMKYIILTSKHHDGFALWNSRVSGFHSRRDLFGEFTESCRKHGLEPGAYYSHWQDWHHPGGGLPHWPEIPTDPAVAQPTQEAYEKYFTGICIPQVRELIENYGIRIFWFDNWCRSPFLTPERLEKLIAAVKSANPDAVVNSRIGVTWNHPDGDRRADYISMGDNTFPEHDQEIFWETSGTLNRSWGFNRCDSEWKTPGRILENLIANVSRNGNYQLNVGPDGNGVIPEPSRKILHAIGGWLKRNGESVYGCGSSVCGTAPGIKATAPRGGTGTFYIHRMPGYEENSISVTDSPFHPASAIRLDTGEPVSFRWDAEHLVFETEKKDLPVTIRFSGKGTPAESGL